MHFNIGVATVILNWKMIILQVTGRLCGSARLLSYCNLASQPRLPATAGSPVARQRAFPSLHTTAT